MKDILNKIRNILKLVLVGIGCYLLACVMFMAMYMTTKLSLFLLLLPIRWLPDSWGKSILSILERLAYIYSPWLYP